MAEVRTVRIRVDNQQLKTGIARADTWLHYKDSADKTCSSAVTNQSNYVCSLQLSRDSPVITLKGKKINDQA